MIRHLYHADGLRLVNGHFVPRPVDKELDMLPGSLINQLKMVEELVREGSPKQSNVTLVHVHVSKKKSNKDITLA